MGFKGVIFGDPKNGHAHINSLGLKKVSKNLLFLLRDRMLKSMVLSADMLEDGRAVMTFIDNVDNNAMTADSYGNHIKTAFHGLGCSHDHIFCSMPRKEYRSYPCEHLSPPMSPSPQTAPPQAATCKTSVTTFSPPIYNTNQSVSTSYLPA